MKSAPKNKGPVGTMPKAAQKHRDYKIDITSNIAVSIAAKRDI